MSDLVKRLRIKAGMIEMGELIEWGSDSALMREAADALEMAAPAVQSEPVAWMTDESWRRMQGGGNDSRGTVPVRSKRTSVATIPLYAALQPVERQPDVAQLVGHQFPSSYPVSGNVYFRESTGEWVLEITASINGAKITARHTQPAGTRPEDVVGLPALYESTPAITQLAEALERSVAGFDALSGMASLDAGERNYARQKAIELNARLAAHRKQQEGEA